MVEASRVSQSPYKVTLYAALTCSQEARSSDSQKGDPEMNSKVTGKKRILT